MGTPTIGGDITGAVEEDSGDIITGDLDDIGFLTGNTDDTWSITITALYGTVTIDASTGTWSYDLDDTHPVVDALDEGETLDDTFTVFMLDTLFIGQGQSDTQVVTITITGVACFTDGTLIETENGPVPVETITKGDRMKTLDNAYQAVVWTGSRSLGPQDFAQFPNLRPVRICTGALGPNQPDRDLIVSPQHRVFVDTKVAERVMQNREMLVPAKKLTDLPGISLVEYPGDVTYFHILLHDHQILVSNGALTESFYAGPEAIKSLGVEAMDEIAVIFPQVLNGTAPFAPARPFADGGTALQEFTRRLVKNDQFVLQRAS